MSEFRNPTRAEIEWHVANGRRLRSKAMHDGLKAIGHWLRGRRSDDREAELQHDPVTSLRSPLTAIRSFTEILIDNPDMARAERARFLSILLTEEKRLEDLIDRLGPRVNARGA